MMQVVQVVQACMQLNAQFFGAGKDECVYTVARCR
jgi:hypothetical protein